MNAAGQHGAAPIRVLFCECGRHGGSVRQLDGFLRQLDRQRFRPGLVSYYRSDYAARPFDLPDLFCRVKIPIAPPGVPDMMKPLGRRWIPTPFAAQYRLLAWYVLRRFRPDAVYLNNLPAQHLPMASSAGRLGIPVVCHLRATRPLSDIDRMALPHVDHFVALSEAGKRHYAEEGIDPDRITVVYNALDLRGFDRRTAEAGRILEPGPFYVTQVGTLSDNKRPLRAVEAVGRLRDRCPDLKLVLVGEGRLESGVRSLVHRLGLEDRVLMLGSRPDVPAILRDSHAGLLLSENEGFGNVVLEYMAAHLPVVVTEIAAIDEMAKRDRTAVVLPDPRPETVADALCALYHDRAAAGAMGEAGRSMVEGSPFVTRRPADGIGECIRKVVER